MNNSKNSTPPDARWQAAVVAMALVLPSVVTWAYFLALDDASPAVRQTTYLLGKTLQFALPAVWAWRVERWRWSDLRSDLAWRGVGWGMAMGVAVAAAMILGYYGWLRETSLFAAAEGEVTAKLAGLGIDAAWKFILLGVFYSLVHAALEEYYWRWFVFGRLQRLLPLPAAIAVSSVGFMAHHVLVLGVYFGWDSPATWLFSAAVAIGGAMWAWLYARSGSLVGPWLSHLWIDAAIFVIGYDLASPLWR